MLTELTSKMQIKRGQMKSPPCVVGKWHRSSIPKVRSSGGATSSLQLVHSDVCGRLEVPSLGSVRYFVTFTDDYSRWEAMFTMRETSEVFDWFVKFETFSEKHTGKRMKVLRTDRGGEYMPNEFDSYLRSTGLVQQLSTVENPHQNGVSERMNRTLMDLVRSMLQAKQLPEEFWAEALSTAVYITNRATSPWKRIKLRTISGVDDPQTWPTLGPHSCFRV